MSRDVMTQANEILLKWGSRDEGDDPSAISIITEAVHNNHNVIIRHHTANYTSVFACKIQRFTLYEHSVVTAIYIVWCLRNLQFEIVCVCVCIQIKNQRSLVIYRHCELVRDSERGKWMKNEWMIM